MHTDEKRNSPRFTLMPTYTTAAANTHPSPELMPSMPLNTYSHSPYANEYSPTTAIGFHGSENDPQAAWGRSSSGSMR